jgi:hypothetical protein
MPPSLAACARRITSIRRRRLTAVGTIVRPVPTARRNVRRRSQMKLVVNGADVEVATAAEHRS